MSEDFIMQSQSMPDGRVKAYTQKENTSSTILETIFYKYNLILPIFLFLLLVFSYMFINPWGAVLLVVVPLFLLFELLIVLIIELAGFVYNKFNLNRIIAYSLFSALLLIMLIPVTFLYIDGFIIMIGFLFLIIFQGLPALAYSISRSSEDKAKAIEVFWRAFSKLLVGSVVVLLSLATFGLFLIVFIAITMIKNKLKRKEMKN